MRVAVDCDDVVMDFWTRVVECHNKEFGTELNADAKIEWDRNEIKQSPHFREGAKYSDWWEWWRDRHWLWSTCDAVPGAIGGLSWLAEQGHYVELITHKPEWARREQTLWLAKWHPYFDRLTFVEPGTPKTEASDAEVLIDDRPSNVRDWNDAGRTAVLFTQPWNEGVETHEWYDPLGTLFRANGWNDVKVILHERVGREQASAAAWAREGTRMRRAQA